jgi:hypothetical protein
MAKNEEAKEPKPTLAKVLKRENVLVLPEGVDPEKLKEAQKLLRSSSPMEAWVVVAEHAASNKTKVIEMHAGVEGAPDALPGVWKAVPVINWKGGKVYLKPPEPKVEVSELVD